MCGFRCVWVWACGLGNLQNCPVLIEERRTWVWCVGLRVCGFKGVWFRQITDLLRTNRGMMYVGLVCAGFGVWVQEVWVQEVWVQICGFKQLTGLLRTGRGMMFVGLLCEGLCVWDQATTALRRTA